MAGNASGSRRSPTQLMTRVKLPTSTAWRWTWLVALSFATLVLLSACTQRYKEFQLRQTPNLRAPVEAYARLLLLREAKKMRVAEHPYQWVNYRFHLGVCFPGTIKEMPREDHRSAITSACGKLRSVQVGFPHPCTDEVGCLVTWEAISAIDSAILFLEQAEPIFAEAERAAAGIPSTE